MRSWASLLGGWGARKEARRIFRMEKQRRTRRWKKTCMNASEKTCVLVTLSQPCLSALPLPHALLSYLSHGGKYPHLGGVSHAPKTVKVNLGTCARVRVKKRSGDRTRPGFNLSCQRTAADEKHLKKKQQIPSTLSFCPITNRGRMQTAFPTPSWLVRSRTYGFFLKCVWAL